MSEFLGLLKSLADYGISGIVAALAMGFAFYQTRRIERLTDKLLGSTTGALNTAAQLFRLNREGDKDDDEPKDEPKKEPRRSRRPALPEPTTTEGDNGEATPDEGNKKSQ